MSRDFSPRECWLVNESSKAPGNEYGTWLNNIMWVCGGITKPMFTEQELQDKRKHAHIAVLGADIYTRLKGMLTAEHFEELETRLAELVASDMKGKALDAFPAEMVDWYYNRHNHHYHEANDEEFMEYVALTYGVSTANEEEEVL